MELFERPEYLALSKEAQQWWVKLSKCLTDVPPGIRVIIDCASGHVHLQEDRLVMDSIDVVTIDKKIWLGRRDETRDSNHRSPRTPPIMLSPFEFSPPSIDPLIHPSLSYPAKDARTKPL